jgi:glycosyltransferase involved in cell wall biosynthesis
MILTVNLIAHGEIYGGAERHLTTLAAGLARRNVNVHAEVFFDRQLAHELRALGIPVRIASPAEILRPVRERPHASIPTILHAHGPRGTFVAFRRARGQPLIRTEHGLDARSPQADTRARLIRYAEEVCLRKARATIVYVTKDLSRSASPRTALLPSRVIYNGDDLPNKATLARPAEMAGNRLNVVFAGRLEEVKAPLDAIAAAALLPTQSQLHLYMLGTGPLEERVKAAAGAPEVAHRVSVLGFRKDARNFIAHADIVILPSRHEGLPFTAIEALGFGVPLVASAVGGLGEVLRHRETAILVDPGDPAHLTAALWELETDHDLLARLSVNGMRLQREAFSSDVMVERHLDLYMETLAARGASGAG